MNIWPKYTLPTYLIRGMASALPKERYPHLHETLEWIKDGRIAETMRALDEIHEARIPYAKEQPDSEDRCAAKNLLDQCQLHLQLQAQRAFEMLTNEIRGEEYAPVPI